METLKPCPFCGGEARSFKYRPRYSEKEMVWDIHCEHMDCYLADGAWSEFDTEEEAIAKWNQRKTIGEHDLKEFYQEEDNDFHGPQ